MANIPIYRFESEEKRQSFLNTYGYKTPKSDLVNVSIYEDNHNEKPFIVECIRENVVIFSDGKEIEFKRYQ